MKRTMRFVAGLAVVVVGLSFVHPFGNPHRVAGSHGGPGTLLVHAGMPEEARQVLITKCADCHSEETHWPWYMRIAPGSWLMERDVVKGRAAMNFSHWDELSPEKQQVEKAKIVQETKRGDMPLGVYVLMHHKAKLTDADLKALVAMSKQDPRAAVADPSSEVPVVPPSRAEAKLQGPKAGAVTQAPTQGAATASAETALTIGDAARGKAVFEKRCSGCHEINTNGEGPALAGVMGRRAASAAGFEYSKALRASGIKWDAVAMERWLTDSDAMVPDSDMSFRVVKPQDRLDLVEFLKTAK